MLNPQQLLNKFAHGISLKKSKQKVNNAHHNFELLIKALQTRVSEQTISTKEICIYMYNFHRKTARQDFFGLCGLRNFVKQTLLQVLDINVHNVGYSGTAAILALDNQLHKKMAAMQSKPFTNQTVPSLVSLCIKTLFVNNHPILKKQADQVFPPGVAIKIREKHIEYLYRKK